MTSANFFFDKKKLVSDLKAARINVYYWDFVVNSLKVSLLFSTGITLLIFFVLSSIMGSVMNSLLFTIFIVFPFVFIIFFKFMLKTPEVKIIRSRKNIDAEITSAVRFFVLDLKANAPVFDALENLVKNFDEIGVYLNDVLTKAKLGDSLIDSLNDSVETVPSEHFRVFIWQIVNHLQTGTDVTTTLNVIIDEIVETQRIEFKKYGKKLNVLSLFYMIIAIIMPTIGFTVIAAILIFIGVTMNLGIIIGFWIVFTILQMIFLVISTGSKPLVES